MNQQINLYHPIFRKQKKIFSARTMGVMLLAVLVGLAMIQVFVVWQAQQLEDRLAELRQQEEETRNRLTRLEDTLPPNDPSTALRERVRRTETALDTKRRAVRLLEQREFGNTSGFSPYLAGLARRDLEGIWFTRIRIDDGGKTLELDGVTRAATHVPALLQNLRQEEAFRGREFRRMEMRQPEEGPHLEFHLSTVPEDESNGGTGREGRR